MTVVSDIRNLVRDWSRYWLEPSDLELQKRFERLPETRQLNAQHAVARAKQAMSELLIAFREPR